jgi:hypothetical protein
MFHTSSQKLCAFILELPPPTQFLDKKYLVLYELIFKCQEHKMNAVL